MNRNDRTIALAALVALLLALVGFYLGGTTAPEEAHVTPASRPSRPSQYSHAPRSRSYSYEQPRTAERFPFDPNTVDSTQLLRLGLQPWQVRNIYKYRAHGGIYRRKEDFARLYGLTVKQYRELEPYIRISSDYQPAAALAGERQPLERDTTRYPVKIEATERVVLNTADTSQLRKVPGIGSYYAKEIVSHGRWLGGYVSVDQLDEIDGFPQEAKKYFVVNAPHPRKLNVNKLSLNELRRHPYVNFYQAKAIVEYRRLHGDIKSLQELRLDKDFPPEAIRRLEPYVEY